MSNIGSIDRGIRIIFGLVLLAVGLIVFRGGGQIAAVIIGAVAILTAGVRFCPMYRLFGVNTCKN